MSKDGKGIGTEQGKSIDINNAVDWKSMDAAIGNSDFKDVRDKGGYFVDKSELIDRILRMESAKVFLFTRPRRFGKSLNLSMIDAYLNLNYKGNTWFDGLKISDLRPDDPLKNASPVIRLDLGCIGVDTCDKAIASTRAVIADVFMDHPELDNSERLSPALRKLYTRYSEGEVEEDEVELSLKRLSKMLEAHYGRKAVIIIDEYDAPINNAFGNPELRSIIDFFRRFLSSALKGNDYLDRAVLTGVMQLSKESIFSGLNNLYVDNILSTGFDDTVGFTEAEVKKMCADFGAPDRFAEAKEWYDGYRFSNTDVYNPWSVLNYVSRKFVPDRYWAGTSKNGIIDTLIAKTDRKTYEDIMKLGSGGMAAEDLSMSVTFDDLSPDHGGSSIYSVMAASGYLRAEKVPSGGYRLSIPNKEMRSVYKRKFMNALDRLRVGSRPVENLCKAVLSNDVLAMESSLRDMMERSFSVRVFDSEHAYQTMVAGMLMSLGDTFRVEADRESGDGYSDIRIISSSPEHPSVIIEIKRAKDGADAESLAQSALEQIRAKRYCAGLKGEVLAYGAAFAGKDVSIASETVAPENRSPEAC